MGYSICWLPVTLKSCSSNSGSDTVVIIGVVLVVLVLATILLKTEYIYTSLVCECVCIT